MSFKLEILTLKSAIIAHQNSKNDYIIKIISVGITTGNDAVFLNLSPYSLV